MNYKFFDVQLSVNIVAFFSIYMKVFIYIAL